MSNYVPPTTPMGGPTGQPGQFPPQQPYPPPPQKKSKALVWVLAGCGTFLVIGIIAVFLGGYFIWNKAREAGLDPELMDKKPEMAIARMMVAANPDVELVSVDDDKGLIIVRDKKTGETLTVNLEEARQGKFVFKKEGEGEVTLEIKAEDDEKGSVEVKSSEGSAKFGSVSVDNVPAWLPRYPDVKPEGTYSAENKGGQSGGFHFVTTDAPNKVISFYEDGLKRAGMTVTTNIIQQNGKPTSGIATAEDSNRKNVAYVNAVVNEDGTRVTVIFEMKQ